MTDHERASRAMFAELCRLPAERWTVVEVPEPGTWYDFADVKSGRYGQCKKGSNGSWIQAPVEGAVILAYEQKR